jgi:beta-lactamase regulating signal transducer with metallopeptidase domain
MNASAMSGMLEGAAAWWADWMFQMTWQVAVLVLVLAAATHLMRRRSAVFLHALWILVLVRLVLPPGFAFPTGWGWWVQPAQVVDTAPEEPAPNPAVAMNERPDETAAPADNRVTAGTKEAGPAEAENSTDATDRETIAAKAPIATAARVEGTAEHSAAQSASGIRWDVCLLLAWAGVAGTLLGMLALVSLRVGRWVREATPITDPALCDLLHDCCERLELGGGIELRNSETCTTPVVVGHFQPVILLPAAVLKELEPDELRSVLIHELQHVRRGDGIFNFFQGVLGALYFFHPLVWWANRRIRELREDACDELTVAALQGRRKPYGSALVKVTEMLGYASPPLALGVMETKHPSHRRLKRILDPSLPSADRLGWGAVATLAAFAALLLPAGAAQTVREPEVIASITPTIDRKIADSIETGPPKTPDTADVVNRIPASGNASSPSSTTGSGNSTELAADLSHNDPPRPLPQTSALRYRWQEGQSHTYSMQIEADGDDQVEMFTGSITYRVRSSGSDIAELVCDGQLIPTRRIKNPARGFAVGPPRYSTFTPYNGISGPRAPTEHILRVNSEGRVESSYGDLQLPYMLGNLSQLMLVPLDGDKSSWEVTGKTAVQIFTESRFPRPRFGPFGGAEDPKRLEATEHTTLVREKTDGDLLTLRKKYELKSTELHNGEPKVELTGDGTVVFDRRQGLPVSLEFIATLNRRDVNYRERAPLKISGRLLSNVETARREEEQQKAQERRPLDEPALEGVIADLTSADDRRVQSALTKLQQAVPTTRQSEIARLLEERLENRDNFSRHRAMRAFVVWCTTENVPRLIRALDDEYFTVRWGAYEALARLKDPRAARPIVAHFEKDRIKAAEALRELGSIAEIEVAGLLDHVDWSIRNDACSILKDIGTVRSIGALETTSRSDENDLVRKSAENAMQAIRGR